MSLRNIANLGMLPVEYLVDALRAYKWSKASLACPKQKQLFYDIVLLAHTVEKGLSVEDMRPSFGSEKIRQMLTFLALYGDDWDKFPLEKAYGCLTAYSQKHQELGFELQANSKDIGLFLKRCERLRLTPRGGVKVISGADIREVSTLETALLSRFSVRQFQNTKVPDHILQRIALMAERVPSQCNRQSARVHLYQDKEKIFELLTLQGGAESFKASVSNLFIVSSEISAWSGFKARSQAYVDGSLMASQVLNACQALGLGTCPLNLAVSNRRELEICKRGGVSSGERLIMMIAFGYPKSEDFVVASSARIGPEKVMVKH